LECGSVRRLGCPTTFQEIALHIRPEPWNFGTLSLYNDFLEVPTTSEIVKGWLKSHHFPNKNSIRVYISAEAIGYDLCNFRGHISASACRNRKYFDTGCNS
jgi:hypothetical protein